ncbi:MAG: c-type cytochrome, partial [Gemmataceae bacterium]
MMDLLLVMVALAQPSTANAAAPPRQALRPGLIVTLTDRRGTTTTRLDSTIAITVATGQSPHPRLSDLKTAQWKGYLNITTAGSYQWEPTTVGGTLSLKIAGKPVAGATELPAGLLPMEATFTASAEATAAQLSVRWSGPGFRAEPLLPSLLSHWPQERPATFAADNQWEQGRFLFEEMACQKCHATTMPHAPRSGPNLSELGKRVQPRWLETWLADPVKVRPHTTMPQMFTNDAAGAAERADVAAYLMTLAKPAKPEKKPGISNDYRKKVQEGERLFTKNGCAICHGKTLPSTAKATDDDPEPDPKAPA